MTAVNAAGFDGGLEENGEQAIMTLDVRSGTDIAIAVRGLGKSYTIAHDREKPTTLAETALRWLKNPLRRPETETFWALNDVSFNVNKGEVVGLIGRNGAGKSTLLKLLSRIAEPLRGEIDLYGRVGSLLEMGAGFHGELTGRENVYLNGTILGMRRKEIGRRFDEIVEFSGASQFLDTPVKRYSSGMYVRLAFAIAAHLSTEILIVDEVLAVGDADFQQKCLAKMRELATSEGRAVVFVSHNMATVRELCSKGLVLEKGHLTYFGDVDGAIDRYLAKNAPDQEFAGYLSPQGLELRNVKIVHSRTGRATATPVLNDDYELILKLKAHRKLEHAAFVIRVRSEEGVLVSTICSVEEGIGAVDLASAHIAVFKLPRLQLLPGRYRLDVSVRNLHRSGRYLEIGEVLKFQVQTAALNGAPHGYVAEHGMVRIANGGSISVDAIEE